jgi:hypothetical protein
MSNKRKRTDGDEREDLEEDDSKQMKIEEASVEAQDLGEHEEDEDEEGDTNLRLR